MIMNSEKQGELAQALSKSRAEYPPIYANKSVTTKSYSFSWADLVALTQDTTAILARNQLEYIIFDDLLPDGRETICVKLIHWPSEQFQITRALIPPCMVENKDFGGTCTYRLRYLIKHILGIIVRDEDDGEELHDEKKNRYSSNDYKSSVISSNDDIEYVDDIVTDTSFPSNQKLVIRPSSNGRPPSEKQLNYATMLFNKKPDQGKKILEFFKVTSLSECSSQQISDLINELK